MAGASVMVGNSSAGMIEAASFGLPVVNVGTRQAGRFCPANVISVPCLAADIREGIRHALTPEFQGQVRALPNPLWRGGAAKLIVEVLRTVELGDALLRKRFVPLGSSPERTPRVRRRRRPLSRTVTADSPH